MTALVALINNFSIFQGSDTNLEKYCKITRFFALIWPIQAQYCVFWVFLVKFLKNKICHSIRKIFPHMLVFSEFCRKSRNFEPTLEISEITRFSAKFWEHQNVRKNFADRVTNFIFQNFYQNTQNTQQCA